jgi:DNA-binding HxlR family transcriptional regulator
VKEVDLQKPLSLAISQLLGYLRSKRCLLILDNTESILKGGASAGQYRSDFEGYGQLFAQIGETFHQSCLMLISREKPLELTVLEGETMPVRSLELTGLNLEEGLAIFQTKGIFTGSKDEWLELIQYYAGNPLVLKIVASTIQNILDNNISEAIRLLRIGSFFIADISQLLERQFQRLTDSEKEVMYLLSLNCEPLSFSELEDNTICPVLKRQLADTLKSLQKKSLIKRTKALFTLQPVVMEYAASQAIAEICEEIVTRKILLFNRLLLIKATAKDYERETQIRLILNPIKDMLLGSLGSQRNLENQFAQIIAEWRPTHLLMPGYLAGNVIELLRELDTDLTN